MSSATLTKAASRLMVRRHSLNFKCASSLSSTAFAFSPRERVGGREREKERDRGGGPLGEGERGREGGRASRLTLV